MTPRDFLPSLPVALLCAAIGFVGGAWVEAREWKDLALDSLWTATMAVDGWTSCASMERVARVQAEHCRDLTLRDVRSDAVLPGEADEAEGVVWMPP